MRDDGFATPVAAVIIASLAVVVTAYANAAFGELRAASRDAARRAEITELRDAIALALAERDWKEGDRLVDETSVDVDGRPVRVRIAFETRKIDVNRAALIDLRDALTNKPGGDEAALRAIALKKTGRFTTQEQITALSSDPAWPACAMRLLNTHDGRARFANDLSFSDEGLLHAEARFERGKTLLTEVVRFEPTFFEPVKILAEAVSAEESPCELN